MDLDEWEVIPSTKPYHYVSSNELLSFLGPDVLVEADYFRCPTPGLSPSPSEHQQQEEEEEEAEEEEMPKEFKDIGISTEFRKETRSPAPATAPASPVNWLEPDPMVFSQGTIMTEKEEAVQMQMERKKEVVVEEEKDCAGFNLWGLSVHGIGAICSFGVATAATLCVFALSTASATCRVRPSPNIQFQIFSDDKRIKDVVQRATGLNHAMTAARGITIPTAQISFGGHYEGL
ncbi:transmembrane protein [Rhynchospora pubera]|uniref:Transmembrane protein n=1 Tax=Rhynchospora pubera TaxID=906938 RepID=A0AAV8GUF5_9POAL|nr:transmembrane protein [Rhynchospora pubera]